MVYLAWSREVINNCKGINEELDNEYSLRSNRITTMISDMIYIMKFSIKQIGTILNE